MKQFIFLGLIALASSDSQDATVYYGRGLAKSTKGDQDAAIADFSKAIALNPKIAEATQPWISQVNEGRPGRSLR